MRIHLLYLFLYITLLTWVLTLSTHWNTLEILNKNNAGQHERREPTDPATRQFKTRCTRRYSPGVCASHVSPVWTFVFQEQNCTERLGCASYFRANRFKTYAVCMRNCQGLIDVYLQMLYADDENKSAPLRRGHRPKSFFTGIQGRKFGSDHPLQQDLEELDYELEDDEQGENETSSLVYKDIMNNYEIFPPDVDREDGEIKSQYDLLHP